LGDSVWVTCAAGSLKVPDAAFGVGAGEDIVVNAKAVL